MGRREAGVPSKELLEEICAIFLLNAPREVQDDFAKFMFPVEAAHWYYEDTIREKYPQLKQYKDFKDFVVLMFSTCELLQPYKHDVDALLRSFADYKTRVPVYGAMLLDQRMERVLLVRGWKSKDSWGFPRGKINNNEAETTCAVREVLEETGYDIEDKIKADHFVETTQGGKFIKLFIVPGLDPENQLFAPKCKFEIGAYAWHAIADLPSTPAEAKQVFTSDDGTEFRFWSVWPFMKPLKAWIKQNRAKQGAAARQQEPLQRAHTVHPVHAPERPLSQFAFDRALIMAAFDAAVATV